MLARSLLLQVPWPVVGFVDYSLAPIGLPLIIPLGSSLNAYTPDIEFFCVFVLAPGGPNIPMPT